MKQNTKFLCQLVKEKPHTGRESFLSCVEQSLSVLPDDQYQEANMGIQAILNQASAMAANAELLTPCLQHQID